MKTTPSIERLKRKVLTSDAAYWYMVVGILVGASWPFWIVMTLVFIFNPS